MNKWKRIKHVQYMCPHRPLSLIECRGLTSVSVWSQINESNSYLSPLQSSYCTSLFQHLLKNYFVFNVERCSTRYGVFFAIWQGICSDCITRAAMLSPPVLHFVMPSLGSCSPALIKVLPNSLWFFIKVKKTNSFALIWFSDVCQAFVLLQRQLTPLFTLKYLPKKTQICQLLQQGESCLDRPHSSIGGVWPIWQSVYPL